MKHFLGNTKQFVLNLLPIWILLTIPVQSKWSKSSIDGYLTGRVTKFLDYYGDDLRADTLYKYYPECNTKCSLVNPCLASNGENKDCISPSFYEDSSSLQTSTKSFPYCRENYVCCFPEKCRKNLFSCTFNIKDDLSQMINEDTLKVIEEMKTDINTNKMNEDMNNYGEILNTMNSNCEASCNGWNNGNIGDIGPNDCPNLCSCNSVPFGKVVQGGDYVCKDTKIDERGIVIDRYYKGDEELTKNWRDKRSVCNKEYECVNELECMNHDVYERKKEAENRNAYPSGNENANANANENHQSNAAAGTTSGIGTTATILIVVGVVALVGIVAGIVLWKKKQSNDVQDGSYQEIDT